MNSKRPTGFFLRAFLQHPYIIIGMMKMGNGNDLGDKLSDVRRYGK